MSREATSFAFLMMALPAVAVAGPSRAPQPGYTFTVTTAYAAGDPFANRLDSAFVEPYGTGYFQVANTGTTTFTGQIGDIAASADAGDLSFESAVITLAPDQSVSIAIGDNAADVGGFNGPAYQYRPGVKITLDGSVSDGTVSGATGGTAISEPIDLKVADADIGSGVYRTDQYGLSSDSFVLQGGDPWGFANATPYALTLADGIYTFNQSVGEPSGLAVLMVGLGALPVLAVPRPARRRTAPGGGLKTRAA